MLEYSRIQLDKRRHHHKLICRIGEDSKGNVVYLESRHIHTALIPKVKAILSTNTKLEERLSALKPLTHPLHIKSTHKSNISTIKRYDPTGTA